MAADALPVPHGEQRKLREAVRFGVRLGATAPSSRDITVTWGALSGLADVTRISRLGVRQVSLPVTAVDNATHQAVTLAGVDLTLLAVGSMPDDTTVWTASTYASGVATALVVGSLVTSPPSGALVVPDAGAGLWARITDTPEVDVRFLALITPF
jgi:hypothetical protein